MQAAADTDILYVPSQYSSRTKEELYEARQRVADNSSSDAPVFFQQMYLNGNDIPGDVELMRSYADLGARGFIVTADAPADSSRQRADRYNVASANSDLTILTWDYLRELRVAFDLPVVAKGILSVEDVRIAIEEGHEAIYLSNHGGRQVDGTPSPFEVCQEIDAQDPSLFQQIDVWADGGVRYGSDVLKFLALGVKMVGVGRGLSYPNTYGIEGVTTAITMLKDELFQDAANLGVTDLKNVSASILNLNPVFPRYSFG